MDPATPPALGGEDGPSTAQVVAQVMASRPYPSSVSAPAWASCASVPSAWSRQPAGDGHPGLRLSQRRIAPHDRRRSQILQAPPAILPVRRSRRCAAPPVTTDPEGLTLLTTPTIEKLRGLNLTGMARALDE